MKEFVENLLPLERNLFVTLNGSDFKWLDDMMFIISEKWEWIPLYAFVVFMFFYKSPYKQALLTLGCAILVFAFSDHISSGIIKPFFERLRPGNHPDFKDIVEIVNSRRGGGYSFISGHATNAVGFAVFVTLLFRNRWVTIVTLTWGLLIAYSRIYLGMHFISDVVGGIIVGALVGFGLYTLLLFLRKKIFKLSDLEKVQMFPQKSGNLLALVFALYFVGIVIYGFFK